MKKECKFFVAVCFLLTFTSHAWAYNLSDHITISPNGQGDLLMFPWFLALDAGWETKVMVINNAIDPSRSVVAKIVIRSFKDSRELLDFLIYLSPADAWVGTIRYDVELDRVVLYSDDDSMLSSYGVWADQTPANQPMLGYPTCPDDGEYMGYLEVFQIWSAATSIDGKTDVGQPGTSKQTIYDLYHAQAGKSNDSILNAFMEFFMNQTEFNPGVDGYFGFLNQLSGYMTFQNESLGMSTTLNAMAFNNYGIWDYVSTAQDHQLGTTGRPHNNITEIEALLAKNNISMPYTNAENTTLHFLTFPTKLGMPSDDCLNVTTQSPYFNVQVGTTESSDFCITLEKATGYDLTEKFTGSPFSGGGGVTLCNELNLIGSDTYSFSEGWAEYRFNQSNWPDDGVINGIAMPPKTAEYSNRNFDDYYKGGREILYIGAPVIPSYLVIGKSGLTSGYGTWKTELIEIYGDISEFTSEDEAGWYPFPGYQVWPPMGVFEVFFRVLDSPEIWDFL
ncbi:MAG: hypothetical protein WA151_24910 [Desulfatirhabdiaceae bacterium]